MATALPTNRFGRFHLLVAGLADIDDAEVPAADPAGQLCPCFDLHGLPRLAQADRAREERPAVVGARAAAAELPSGEARELEYVGVLQEEITFFRGIAGPEPGEIDLAVVYLRSRKIRVQRQDARQRGGVNL